MISLIAVPASEKKHQEEISKTLSHLPVCYLICTGSHEKKYQWVSDLGWKSVDSQITYEDQERFLREYLAVIATFNQWNGKELKWWATHFSSKNRLNSPVLPFLEQWFRCLCAIESCPEHSTLVLLGVSWEVIQGLKAIRSNHQWNIRVIASKLDPLRYRLLGKIRFWRTFLGEIRAALISIRCVRRNYNFSTSLEPSISTFYLIKSFTYQRNFHKNGSYQDPFFGKLSEYIQQSVSESISVMTVALGFQDKKECYSLMNTLTETVHPLEAYLHYRDVYFRALQWIWKLLFFPFKMKGEIQFMGYDATMFFKELIRCGGFSISFFQALHFDIARRLGQKYQIKTCLMTYEGRPWERFFMTGLRKANENIQIIGCQHTVIPISATDMFLHPKEIGLIPLPDKIVTTGMTPKKILERYSAYPKEQVYTGCALRFESLQKRSVLVRSKQKHFVLLVAFTGSSDEVPLLNYSLGQAFLNKDIIFRMRTHPIFSWNQLMSLSSWRKEIPENVGNSTSFEVSDDLEICDAVLYLGTTVALESLMVGKPIIHFDRGDLLNFDPLFEFTDFKWQVQAKDSLQTVIQEIQALPETLYNEHQQQGIKYMKEYFYPVNNENLEKFLHT